VAEGVSVSVWELIGLNAGVEVCEGEKEFPGVGEKIIGVCDGAIVGMEVAWGPEILKKGLSGSLELFRPPGAESQNGNAGPRAGISNKRKRTMKRNFTRSAPRTHRLRLLIQT
jgi:hypothetical protein